MQLALILKIAKWVGVIGGCVALYFLAKKAYYSVWEKMALANPTVKEMAVSLDSLSSENMTQFAQLKTFEAEVDDYQKQIIEDSINHQSVVIEFQQTLNQLSSEIKTKDNLIFNYKKGIQIDVIKLTFKDGLFSKPKLIDSTYTSAWGFGVLE